MMTTIENSEGFKTQPGQDRQGMSNAANLQNSTPESVNRLTRQGVNFNSVFTVKPDTISKTQLDQSINNIRSLIWTLTTYDAIQNTVVIEDGNAASVSGITISGIFSCGGQDFLINGQGCYTVEQLSEQGHLQEIDQGYIRNHLAFLKKFVMRWISC